jgi:hypothetical protein
MDVAQAVKISMYVELDADLLLTFLEATLIAGRNAEDPATKATLSTPPGASFRVEHRVVAVRDILDEFLAQMVELLLT